MDDPYDHEVDLPLDAFDKELLAEIPREGHQQASQGPARISLPARYGNGGLHRDDQYKAPSLGSSSPSPFGPASSPTVAALQNRRPPYGRASQYHAPIQAPFTTMDETLSAPSAEARGPPVSGPPIIRGVPLVCTDQLPDKIRSIFQYEILNAVQSKCYHTAFHTDGNLVLSAPTGSGKTLVMELAIARLLVTTKDTDFKVIYMAPIKALCAERQQDWQRKFGMHGLDCAELTGDTDYHQLRKVQQANIIITTPEKWDSVTRKWRDNAKLVQLIKLFLVDEVHILKDSRGATLEAVISRMKSVGTPIRFVALSATVPNSEDIATWLGKDSASPHLPAQREVFDESFRPVKLEKHVYGFQGAPNDFQFDVKLRNQVLEMIARHSKAKPTMVFCMTRKSAAQTAHTLASAWGQASDYSKPWRPPARPVAVKDAELRALLPAGVAFHHAGINQDDRQAVEQGFINGNINVICSTSTLAVGVNLPCYMVILQGTTTYGDAGPQEYSDLEIMQMLGRAGRPQYENSACAAILTREEKADRYRKIVSGQDLLESTLHRNLIEHLNAEIGLGTIFNLESAKRWLASTFLRVRLQKNPDHYQLQEGINLRDDDAILRQICEKDISLLSGADLVQNEGNLKCTELGDAMARYYIKFETMKTFAAIPPKAKMSEILAALAQAAEFLDVRMRGGEKSYYKELNKANEIRFPIKVDVALPSHKVSLILQASLGSVQEPSGPNFDKNHPQYHTDTMVVFSHANRLIRGIIDCQLCMKDAVSAKNALELARSIAARAWDNTPNILKQVQGIGDVYMRKLAAKGVNSIDTLLTTDPQRINLILGKPQPFGQSLLKKLSGFPNLMVSIKETERKLRKGKGVTLKLKCEVGFLNETTPLQFGRTQVFVCFLLEDSNGSIIDFRRFGARKLENREDIMLTVELTKPTSFLRSHIMCDELAGTSRFAEIKLQGIPSSVYLSPNTDDLTPGRAPGVQIATETFDDDDVGDEELLAAASNPTNLANSSRFEDGIEVVLDIDELMQEDTSTMKLLKRKPSKRAPVEDEDDDEQANFKEPVQLENGHWTCQHLCKEKGLDCKHKCCKEGVAKPKRRPKMSTQHTGGQRKLTNMATVAKPASTSTTTSLSAKPASKKRKLSSEDDLDDYDMGFSLDDFDWDMPTSFQASNNALGRTPEISTQIAAAATGRDLARESTQEASVLPSEPEPTETEEERKKRLFDEDQKRRWAELPAWMFEEFGHFTTIIDG